MSAWPAAAGSPATTGFSPVSDRFSVESQSWQVLHFPLERQDSQNLSSQSSHDSTHSLQRLWPQSLHLSRQLAQARWSQLPQHERQSSQTLESHWSQQRISSAEIVWPQSPHCAPDHSSSWAYALPEL